MDHVGQLKVTIVSCAIFSSCKDQGMENSLGHPKHTGKESEGDIKQGPYLSLCACYDRRVHSVFRLNLQNLIESQNPFVYLMPGCLSVAS